ncbi:MAG: gamma-glutamyltransferase [Geminicoccaceae bacterium]|nr:gamma-glutamyltransferase [Geminicoccaceae bacterium]
MSAVLAVPPGSAFAPEWRVHKSAVESRAGIVVAQNQKAARAGVAVLEAGGNAVDAAIAAGFALGVVEPWMSGLGGGGAMLVWDAAQSRGFAIDMGMVAPRALDPADFPLTGRPGGDLFGWPEVVADRNLEGPLSICVPSWLAGVELARTRLGTMPLAELLAPAIALAREGLAIDWYASLMIASSATALARHPEAKAVFLPEGQPPAPSWSGEPAVLPLPALARTLERLAREGAESFYRGGIAADLACDLAQVGARLSAEDLASYEARPVEPLPVPWGPAQILAMPGLFGGASFARAAALLAREALGGAHPSAAAYLAYARALRAAQEERLARLGDIGPGASCTSHLCVVDRKGNLVSLTQTLLSLFGSKVLSPRTGILLNNGVMWFDPRAGRPNSIGPGKRPLANMCPLLGLAPERRFALGASGGRRILPAVFQLASFLLDFGMDLETAFHTPRIDTAELAGIVADERLGAEIVRALETLALVRGSPPLVYPLLFACPSAVLHELASDRRFGIAEPLHPWAGGRAEAAPRPS